MKNQILMILTNLCICSMFALRNLQENMLNSKKWTEKLPINPFYWLQGPFNFVIVIFNAKFFKVFY